MMVFEIFSARELAVIFWFLVFIFTSFFKREFRREIFDIIKIICTTSLLKLFALNIFFTIFLVSFLNYFSIWNCSNLKSTIIWFFSFVLVEIYLLSKSNDLDFKFNQALRKIVSWSLVFNIFIGFSVFSIWVELVIVPLFFFISYAYFYSLSDVKFRKISIGFGFLLFFGLIIYLFSYFYYFIFDFSAEVLWNYYKEEFVMAFLSILFIPFLYFWFLFFAYENIYSSLRLNVVDEKLRTRTKWMLFWKFKNDKEYLLRWKNYAIIAKIISFQDVKDSIDHIFRVRFRDSNPMLQHPSDGWSPFLSSNFLTDFGIKSTHYRLTQEGHWFSGSNQIRLGGDITPNTLDYWLTGTESTIKMFELYLNLNRPENQIEALNLYRSCAKKLADEVLNEAWPKIKSKVLTGEPFEWMEIDSIFVRQIGRNFENCGSLSASLKLEIRFFNWPYPY